MILLNFQANDTAFHRMKHTLWIDACLLVPLVDSVRKTCNLLTDRVTSAIAAAIKGCFIPNRRACAMHPIHRCSSFRNYILS